MGEHDNYCDRISNNGVICGCYDIVLDIITPEKGEDSEVYDIEKMSDEAVKLWFLNVCSIEPRDPSSAAENHFRPVITYRLSPPDELSYSKKEDSEVYDIEKMRDDVFKLWFLYVCSIEPRDPSPAAENYLRPVFMYRSSPPDEPLPDKWK